MTQHNDTAASAAPAYAGVFLALGAGIGAALGIVAGTVFLEDISMGLIYGGGVGAALGLVFGAAVDAQRKKGRPQL
ncbi:MAG: hypothetical protein GX605_10295 [Chloroflexi bacterium]|nr:hypothetical protein [Chloroflexota bacterium]